MQVAGEEHEVGRGKSPWIEASRGVPEQIAQFPVTPTPGPLIARAIRTPNVGQACHDGGMGEREPTWWEQNGYKVAVFGFLVLMFGVLPLIISGR